MKKIIVIDLEVNKEFVLIDIDIKTNKAVIYNDEYRYCSQKLSKIKFTNNQIDKKFKKIEPPFTNTECC